MELPFFSCFFNFLLIFSNASNMNFFSKNKTDVNRNSSQIMVPDHLKSDLTEFKEILYKTFSICAKCVIVEQKGLHRIWFVCKQASIRYLSSPPSKKTAQQFNGIPPLLWSIMEQWDLFVVAPNTQRQSDSTAATWSSSSGP